MIKPASRWWVQEDRPTATVEQLQQLTREYWRMEGSLEERLGWYIENLLPGELACADGQESLTFHSCDVLVFLVGHSIEPLLQTVSVFQPARLILLLNRWYDLRGMPEPQTGTQWGQEIDHFIRDRLAPCLAQPPQVALQEVSDRPDAVFQTLCDLVLADRQGGRDVIVDITGAKKSIVAGAFLFAAYADIPISYVDFDEYDDLMRRPLGYTCRIGTLANPYDAFRLREWERVRRLYQGYHFHAAAETLVGIVERREANLATLRAENLPAAESLLDLLRFYEAWDDGDYQHASRALPGLQERVSGFEPPMAVTLLGEVWPRSGDGAGAQEAALQLLRLHDDLRQGPRSIFRSNELLLAYARDELAKIERLVEGNEDNRSALLRAAGLDELLLKVRLIRLWHAGQIGLWDHDENYQGSCHDMGNTTLREKIYDALLNHHGTDHMRRALEQKDVRDRRLNRNVPAFVRLDVWRSSYRARPIAGSPRLVDYDQGIDLEGRTLTDLRNQAIHMYLYVTDAIARAAVAIARANLAEFEHVWAPLAGPVSPMSREDVECLPWDKVCRLCALDFLPLSWKVGYEP